jgi:rhamnose utilization protein RhaD (predicted bifunctional aldolase and dehydrogenase)
VKNHWCDLTAAEYVARYGEKWGEDLALRTYLSVIIGSQDCVVLHGGGNSSVKTFRTNVLGERVPIIFVKASGSNMAVMEPDGYTGLDLEYLKKLRALPALSDEEMVNEFRTHLFDSRAAAPSIETLVHAFIPKKLNPCRSVQICVPFFFCFPCHLRTGATLSTEWLSSLAPVLPCTPAPQLLRGLRG